MPNSIKADTFVGELSIKTANGRPVPNIQNLRYPGTYRIEIPIGNNGPGKVSGPTHLLIGLGLRFDINPATVNDVPYLKFTFHSEPGQQPKINAEIERALPANYRKTLSFKVHTTGQGSSAISANWLSLPGLEDQNPGNNGNALEYSII